MVNTPHAGHLTDRSGPFKHTSTLDLAAGEKRWRPYCFSFSSFDFPTESAHSSSSSTVTPPMHTFELMFLDDQHCVVEMSVSPQPFYSL